MFDLIRYETFSLVDVCVVVEALDAHTVMSTQALNSPSIQNGMKDILLNHAGLWESLREPTAT